MNQVHNARACGHVQLELAYVQSSRSKNESSIGTLESERPKPHQTIQFLMNQTKKSNVYTRCPRAPYSKDLDQIDGVGEQSTIPAIDGGVGEVTSWPSFVRDKDERPKVAHNRFSDEVSMISLCDIDVGARTSKIGDHVSAVCEEWGIFQVVDLVTEMEHLSREFFALPAKEKLLYDMSATRADSSSPTTFRARRFRTGRRS